MAFSIKVSFLPVTTPSHTCTFLQLYKSYQYLKVHLLCRWKSFNLSSLDSTRVDRLESSRRQGLYVHDGSHVSDISLQHWAVEAWSPESEAPACRCHMGMRAHCQSIFRFLTEVKYLHFMWHIPILNVGSIKKVKATATVWPMLDPWSHTFASSGRYWTCEAWR